MYFLIYFPPSQHAEAALLAHLMATHLIEMCDLAGAEVGRDERIQIKREIRSNQERDKYTLTTSQTFINPRSYIPQSDSYLCDSYPTVLLISHSLISHSLTLICVTHIPQSDSYQR